MNNNLLHCFGLCNCTGQSARKRIPIADKAFEALSEEEKDRVYEDLYGTEDPIEESSDFISAKIADLDRELGLLSEGIRKHYTLAIDIEKQQQSSSSDSNEGSYITSPKFQLMFLRADRFDACKAAKRLARYFTEKLELFGEQKLASKIKQEDFIHFNDNQALLHGGISFTGATDRSGRSIVVVRPGQIWQENPVSMRRVFFYTFQNVLLDQHQGSDESATAEISQKKGVIVVCYNMNALPFQRPSDVMMFSPIFRMVNFALPVRVAGVHYCYNDYRDHLILNLALVVHPREIRARFHFHFRRTHLECMLSIMPYGIIPNTLPFSGDGDFQHDKLWEYLQMWRRMLEE